MKINHKEIIATDLYSIVGRMAILIEETLHRERTILHTSIFANNERFFGAIIWQEKEGQ